MQDEMIVTRTLVVSIKAQLDEVPRAVRESFRRAGKGYPILLGPSQRDSKGVLLFSHSCQLDTDSDDRGELKMALTIICPNLRCRSVLQVSDQVRGQKVRCGRCGKNFIVPPASTAPAKEPKAPAKAPAQQESA
jgi:hypothetical protein